MSCVQKIVEFVILKDNFICHKYLTVFENRKKCAWLFGAYMYVLHSSVVCIIKMLQDSVQKTFVQRSACRSLLQQIRTEFCINRSDIIDWPQNKARQNAVKFCSKISSVSYPWIKKSLYRTKWILIKCSSNNQILVMMMLIIKLTQNEVAYS